MHLQELCFALSPFFEWMQDPLSPISSFCTSCLVAVSPKLLFSCFLFVLPLSSSKRSSSNVLESLVSSCLAVKHQRAECKLGVQGWGWSTLDRMWGDPSLFSPSRGMSPAPAGGALSGAEGWGPQQSGPNPLLSLPILESRTLALKPFWRGPVHNLCFYYLQRIDFQALAGLEKGPLPLCLE